jgi:hypothetical protein
VRAAAEAEAEAVSPAQLQVQLQQKEQQLAAMFNSGQPMPKVCSLSLPSCIGTSTVHALLCCETVLDLMLCRMPYHT